MLCLSLSADDLDEILKAMGFRPSKEELMYILAEIDEDGLGEIEADEFCQLCTKFLVEDPDIFTLKMELKDTFRIYDKDGQGVEKNPNNSLIMFRSCKFFSNLSFFMIFDMVLFFGSISKTNKT